MTDFNSILPVDITENVFKLISKDFALVTAGDKNKFNTMTVSWGGLGELWSKKVAFIFIRPQRYTYEFIENHDTFTISFYDDSYKGMLAFCGSKSGRDVDKAAETGLEPIFEGNSVYFKQAKLVLVCKKIYFQDLNPENFLSDDIMPLYKNDFHRMYVGEIIKVYKSIA